MPKSIVALAGAIVALILGAAIAFAQADPADVVRGYFDARNRHDVAAALAFFTDDAVYDGGRGLCAQPPPCVGKAAIQKELERLASSQATITSLQVSGDTVTARIEVRGGVVLKAVGVERQINLLTILVRGGKIASFQNRLDTSDPQTAAVLKYLESHPAGQLPRTGEPALPLPTAFGIGAMVLVLGLAVRRARRPM